MPRPACRRSMKLTVPRASSGPHRSQLLTRADADRDRRLGILAVPCNGMRDFGHRVSLIVIRSISRGPKSSLSACGGDGGSYSTVLQRCLDPVDRVIDSHVERVVAAERDVVLSDAVDEEPQRRCRVDERVEPHPTQIPAGRMLTRARILPLMPRVVGAAAVARQPSAGVRGPDPEFREPVQHAPEDEARQRDRGLSRVPDVVEHVPHVEALAETAAPRMDEDGHVQRHGRLPELEERRVVELDPRSGGRRDLHADRARDPRPRVRSWRTARAGRWRATVITGTSRSGACRQKSATARFTSPM